MSSLLLFFYSLCARVNKLWIDFLSSFHCSSFGSVEPVHRSDRSPTGRRASSGTENDVERAAAQGVVIEADNWRVNWFPASNKWKWRVSLALRQSCWMWNNNTTTSALFTPRCSEPRLEDKSFPPSWQWVEETEERGSRKSETRHSSIFTYFCCPPREARPPSNGCEEDICAGNYYFFWDDNEIIMR